MTMTKIFIDDLRQPPDETWVVVRSSAEAIAWFLNHGCPDEISFDHDLGGEDTAMRVVHWMIETDMDSGGAFIPANFSFTVHSANPVGRENIRGWLNRYLKYKHDQACRDCASSADEFSKNLFEPIWSQYFPPEILLYIFQQHTVGSDLPPYNFAFVSESPKTGSFMFEIESGYENGDAYLKIFDLDYADDIENPAYRPTVEDFIKRVQPFIVSAE